MPVLPKYVISGASVLRDVRSPSQKVSDYMSITDNYAVIILAIVLLVFMVPEYNMVADVALVFVIYLGRWWNKRAFILPFKFPKIAGVPDKHNPKPGKGGAGKSEGILFLGNLDQTDHPDNSRELWLTNEDARTHMLFLGTTGSGKTEGLKSIVSNSLAWGSGFVYVDGKADTDLWASLYSLARRFGRDDDMLVLNYMTANSDSGSLSNTMNPFSNGSSSYLTNMVTSLMPDAGGDNAMWKERAVALLGALMPALTYLRDREGLLLDVGILRDYIELEPIIRLSRNAALPERIARGLQGYLSTLPGYVDAAFDDEGHEIPPSPDKPMYDLQTARQQHGYLSMQFTRSLQSLADEYGYIFKAQLADIDVLDVVLNRRILVALIPSLEKSGDEAANLGKIIAASLKGMMGATLGNTVEGSWEHAIGNKQTRSAASFMTVFDEVGYYTAQGMAVMAAQARSLGFSLIFAAQDLPSMEKRVKQEAQSILANCNLKIFGKLEDPTSTQEFFDKHVGGTMVMQTSGLKSSSDGIKGMIFGGSYEDSGSVGGGVGKKRASYDALRTQREGEVHMLFAEYIVKARLFYASPEPVKALRVQRLLPVPRSTSSTAARERALSEVTARLHDPDWTAETSLAKKPSSVEVTAMAQSFETALTEGYSPLESGIVAMTTLTRLAPSSGRMSAFTQAPSASAGRTIQAPPKTPPKTPPPRVKDEVLNELVDLLPEEPEQYEEDDLSHTLAEAPLTEEGAAVLAAMDPSEERFIGSGFDEEDEEDEDALDYPLSSDASFAPRETDLDMVPHSPYRHETSFDADKTGLSDEIKDLMKRVAGKFNEKLGLIKKTDDNA